MTTSAHEAGREDGGEADGVQAGAVVRVALLGNPNTGKTTLFNRLCGLRHHTSNFPGTTQEARLGFLKGDAQGAGKAGAVEIVDLPGIYSLELDQLESDVCRRVLAGTLAPAGHAVAAPDVVLVVVDATNLARNLLMVGEVLRRRLPTVVLLNMIDLARRQGELGGGGRAIDRAKLEARLGCAVLECSARSGEGVERIIEEIRRARVPNHTPPGTVDGLEGWTDEVYGEVMVVAGDGRGAGEGGRGGDGGEKKNQDRPGTGRLTDRRTDRLTDRLDAVFTHPVLGLVAFVAIMFGVFWTIFSLAKWPMDGIEWVFAALSGWAGGVMPEGILRDFLTGGVINGIGSTVIFVPQICLLFFLISILEDTGYLARGAFVMDRVLRPFGLPGHSFVPLLSSHACALPGIMSARGIPDRRERLATILIAPFMSCTARIPVYVLLTGLLFRDSAAMQAVAFVGCYALGMLAGLVSALVARRTILKGDGRPMALELPTYKRPSLRTALLTMVDRGLMFVKKAGTNILAICIVLWWLSSYPKGTPPAESVALHQKVVDAIHGWKSSDPTTPEEMLKKVEAWQAEADHLEAKHQQRVSFAGRLGHVIEPVFAPLGYDWQLSVGVLTSFAAREVFVSTMSVITLGEEPGEDVRDRIAAATRDDGVTPVFTKAACWSLLVYYVLAMQCLPTLVLTARESGSVKWAILQLTWMSGLAYLFAGVTYRVAVVMGVPGGAGGPGLGVPLEPGVFSGMRMPWGDWQFWVTSVIFGAFAWYLFREVVPAKWRRKKVKGRATTLTIGGRAVKK